MNIFEKIYDVWMNDLPPVVEIESDEYTVKVEAGEGFFSLPKRTFFITYDKEVIQGVIIGWQFKNLKFENGNLGMYRGGTEDYERG